MSVVVSIAVRYLVARFRQSLLTIGGIAVGVLALTVIQALMGGFLRDFVQKLLIATPHVTVRDRPLEPRDPSAPTRDALRPLNDPLLVQLPRPPVPDEEKPIRSAETVQERIRQVPGVVATTPTVSGQVMVGFGAVWEPVSVNGILPSRQDRVLNFSSYVKEGTAEPLERDLSTAVVGWYLADRMRLKVGDRIVVRSEEGEPLRFRIVGLYRSQVYEVDNASIWVNLRRAQALLGLDGTVNQIQVRVADYNAADEVARRIEYAVGMEAESWMEANRNYLNLFSMFTGIMLLVNSFTMVVAGFGIAGNLITTVAEKSFDIGVLKAMGLQARQLTLVFLLLAVMTMAIGVAIGLTGAYFSIEAIGKIPSAQRAQFGAVVVTDTMPVVNDWTIYAISGGFALAVSVLAGISPALRAARLEPLTIIRGAG
ncbi:MAG: ABC transporter permease [Armatimonadota bacterium]